MATKREIDKARADARRRFVAIVKTELGCMDCGYNENAFALEFDHRDNSGIAYTGKQKTVASMMYSSWDTIISEIKKCDIVCANCHAIRTMTRKSGRLAER